jgi:phosphopantothenoylcysteine decarboxylase/phosphopantothenate--cysteine ligase
MPKKKNILVAVCGGIAAYKACELVRSLVKAKYEVKVVMTQAAAEFVTPLTFQTLARNPVYTGMFDLSKEENIRHISLADWADLAVIAPASANTLSKIAHGICDNLLTSVICALPQKTKVIFAPAMNEQMWNNPLIQENVKILKRIKNYKVLNVGKGELACGITGCGRMSEPKDIFAAIIR